MYKVLTSSISAQHIGKAFEHIEVGNIITFEDGFAFQIGKLFDSEDSVLIVDGKYQMVLTKE